MARAKSFKGMGIEYNSSGVRPVEIMERDNGKSYIGSLQPTVGRCSYTQKGMLNFCVCFALECNHMY